MKRIHFFRTVCILVVIVSVCISSVFATNAASKIKSKSVKMNVSGATISIGDIITLNAQMKPTNSTDTISWTSDNSKVATVNKYGVVTALSEGAATITAKTSSKKKTKCAITVKKHLTVEEVEKLISKKCLSEESIKQMISNSTLSEQDVRRIISENLNNDQKVVWEDGMELKNIGDSSTMSNDDFIIESISIKKYHCKEVWNGVQQKYKYILSITGSMPEHLPPEELSGLYADITIHYLKENGSTDVKGYVYPFYSKIRKKSPITRELKEENGKFEVIFEQYDIFCDYDEFYVNDMTFDIYR